MVAEPRIREDNMSLRARIDALETAVSELRSAVEAAGIQDVSFAKDGLKAIQEQNETATNAILQRLETIERELGITRE